MQFLRYGALTSGLVYGFLRDRSLAREHHTHAAHQIAVEKATKQADELWADHVAKEMGGTFSFFQESVGVLTMMVVHLSLSLCAWMFVSMDVCVYVQSTPTPTTLSSTWKRSWTGLRTWRKGVVSGTNEMSIYTTSTTTTAMANINVLSTCDVNVLLLMYNQPTDRRFTNDTMWYDFAARKPTPTQADIVSLRKDLAEGLRCG